MDIMDDDGVFIEEEEETFNEQIPRNEDPAFVSAAFSNVTVFLQQYGWLLVIGCLILLYLRSWLEKSFQKMKEKVQEANDKKYDPDVAQSRLEAMEAARRRLQEDHDAKASIYAEKQKQKEEEKRKLKIEDWDNHQQGKGYKSKVKPKPEEDDTNKGFKRKPKLRDSDYNPLMGAGGGSYFRPTRRGGGGGGGG